MNTNTLVAVTGASGFVGREVVRGLLAAGHRVRALTRDRVRAKRVFASIPGGGTVELVQGEAHEAAAAGELAAGASACVHLVGIIREAGAQTFRRCHIDATRSILTACAERGVSRVLHMSALGVCSEGVSEYQRTKWEAERLVRASGLRWTIFRPGLIHGPNGEFTRMMAGWVRGSEPPKFFLPYFTREVTDTSVPLGPGREEAPVVEPVAVEDVAEAFVRALGDDRTVGEIYNLVGSERLSWPELLTFVRDTVPGARENLQPWGVPSAVAALGATAAGLVGLGSLLPFDAGMARMGARDSVGEREKVKSHLGIEAKAFRAAFKGYASRV